MTTFFYKFYYFDLTFFVKVEKQLKYEISEEKKFATQPGVWYPPQKNSKQNQNMKSHKFNSDEA